MIKKILALSCIVATSLSCFSQTKKEFEGTPILSKKSSLISLSIGTPNKIGDFLNFDGISPVLGAKSNNKSFGPLMMDYEYFINDNFGIGTSVLIAFANSQYRTLGQDYTGDIAQYQVGISSYYHYNTTDKLDPYVKTTVGINLWDGKYRDNNNKNVGNFKKPTSFGLRSQIGIRYFLSENIAVQGEGSLTFSPNFTASANIGLAYKLN
jgi:outer membrane protein W